MTAPGSQTAESIKIKQMQIKEGLDDQAPLSRQFLKYRTIAIDRTPIRHQYLQGFGRQGHIQLTQS